jgi:acyl carrier protein
MLSRELLSIINQVRANKLQAPVVEPPSETRLREDLGFGSLDLAELTVRIDERFGVDVFADGLVQTIDGLQEKISRSTH